MVGQQVSHFDIVEELGRGGMGLVYKGRDTRLHRYVALKFLSPLLSEDPAARSRFLQEARAAAALEHVNVCSIFEISAAKDETPFIVMGFCDGSSLRDILASRRLELGDVASFGRQIASGLAHAHRIGVIHRDLKPGNIMITGGGTVKIVDFGIASLRDATTALHEEVPLGTTPYMSPEQLRGEPSDHRSDIWSFGVLLYEMATGTNPFLGNYDQASVYNVLNADPPLLRKERKDIPAEWESVAQKCLEKDPSDRFSSFEEVLDAFSTTMVSGPVDAAGAAFEGYLPKVSARVFVGRGEESVRLRERFGSRSGKTTLVFGESGIGKTQLVSRILAEKVAEGGHALWGRCLFSEGALPYHPFASALKKGFPASVDVVSEIETLAAQAGIDFGVRRSQLRAFLSVSDDSDQVLNREQLWYAVLLVYRLLSSRDRPLYLVVDDLQWADPATVALFCYLARSIDQSAIHLIGMYRLDPSGHRDEASRERLIESLRQLRIDGLAEQIDLARFGRSESDELIQYMLDGDPVDEDLKAHAFEQSEGLPLFLTESLNLLRLENRISKVDGVWRLPEHAVRGAPVSDRIQDVILQRLAVLDDHDRELLEVAATEGELFTSGPLEACLGWPRIKILKRLQEIEKKHQLVMHESAGYRFDHTMIQQVLYDGILPELRQEYHRMIASALEASHGTDDDQAGAIALHLEASGQEPAAVPYLLRAANRSKSVYASEQALDAYEKLDRIRRNRMPDDSTLAMAVARGLGDVRYALGDVQLAAEHFGVYLDLARTAGDLKSELEARRKLAESLRVTGHLDEALDLSEKTLAQARSSGVPEEIVRALQTCAEVRASRGAYQESADYAQEALNLAEDRGDRGNQSVSESILGFAFWHMGSFRRSEEHFSKALQTQRAIGNRLGMATTLNFLALSLWKLGRFEEALRCARESVDVKRRISLFRAVPGSLNIIGDVYRDAFALDKAIRFHTESLELATSHDNKGGMCDNLRDLGADHLEKGDLTTAEDFMRRALELAESSGIKWYETRSTIGLAEVLLRAGETKGAGDYAERGLELAEEIQAQELLIEAKWVEALVFDENQKRKEVLLEEALAGADGLELVTVSWRIRLDLADLFAREGRLEDAQRLRSGAQRIVDAIGERIADAELRDGFLGSKQVARIRGD